MKSTVDQIRQRFDNDVERFSNLETGQAAAMDSPLCTRLIAQAAAAVTSGATRVLDVGCGAGNYTLVLLEELHRRDVAVTLLDLSSPMLDRAAQRVAAAVDSLPTTLQADIRDASLGEKQFDVILAAAVLHHLRTDAEWDAVYAKLFAALRVGGCLWVYDMVDHAHPAIAALMRQRYSDYLDQLAGRPYRDKVLAYVDAEDTPRPLVEQLQRMAHAGFSDIEVLHKQGCFAAFGGLRLS